MNDTVQTEILTLEDLQQQKAEAFRGICAPNSKFMADTARNLFCSDCSRCGQKEQLSCVRFNTGMAVFDGVMLGVKLMRKVRKIFRR